MDISETIDGGVYIHTKDGTVLLTAEQAYSCLEWLWERRDKLRGRDNDKPTSLLRDFTQEEYQAFSDEQAAKQTSAPSFQTRANGHISYAEALSRRLCPYCGDVGVLYSGPERDDADFQAYQCSNLHIFYVDRIERFTERR